jgi:type IV pilus assembly protein PilB
MNLLRALAAKNIIDEAEIAEIEAKSETQGKSIENILAERGVSPSDVMGVKSSSSQVPTRTIGDHDSIPFEILSYIPEESAKHYKFAPLDIRDGVLEIGLVDPDNIDALDALNFISTKANMPFKVYLISAADFEKVLKMYEGLSGEVSKALTELETELADETVRRVAEEGEKGLSDKSRQTVLKEEAPITKIVANMLRYAVEGNASDIHVEHTGSQIRVRFRVDGLLSTSLVLPTKVHQAVVARVKILSQMKLDEKRKPQDGRFSATIKGRKIDFRVSTFPSYYGEKVVMRILDSSRGLRKLDEMGLSNLNLDILRRAITRPYGLILISGPTGSGKTTTLYSMMSELDRDIKNVLSLEDPVEYHIAGINQSQVRPEIGYTFSSGLRTTLRQDPDIIMVGEIRDKETAQLAIQAALTGHLVLSTIHTNDAIGVIPRLVDMGVDPYLIAPTLAVAVAQRLVKTLCPGTGKKVEMKESLKTLVQAQFTDLSEDTRGKLNLDRQFYEAEPSTECPSGTRGRMAVYEMFEVDAAVEDIILKNPVDSEIRRIVRAKGMLTMREDAILKAFDKTIPFQEINTVGGEALFI